MIGFHETLLRSPVGRSYERKGVAVRTSAIRQTSYCKNHVVQLECDWSILKKGSACCVMHVVSLVSLVVVLQTKEPDA